MKKILLIFCVLAGFEAISQKHFIRVDFSEVHDKERIVAEIHRIGLIGIDPASENRVHIKYDLSKVHQLEGLSNSFSGTAKVWINLKSSTGKTDTTWNFSANIKAKNKWEVYEKLSAAFIEESQGIKGSIMIINTFLDRYYSLNCSAVLQEANNFFERKNGKEAYVRVKKIESGPCEKDAKALIARIENRYSEEFCEEILPRIKVLANSGIAYQMEKAIELLYRYPPKAKCGDEVQQVAKSVGNYISKLPQKQSIEINNILSNGQSYNKIFEY